MRRGGGPRSPTRASLAYRPFCPPRGSARGRDRSPPGIPHPYGAAVVSSCHAGAGACPFPARTFSPGGGPTRPHSRSRSNEAVAAGTKHLCSQALRWGRGGGGGRCTALGSWEPPPRSAPAPGLREHQPDPRPAAGRAGGSRLWGPRTRGGEDLAAGGWHGVLQRPGVLGCAEPSQTGQKPAASDPRTHTRPGTLVRGGSASWRPHLEPQRGDAARPERTKSKRAPQTSRLLHQNRDRLCARPSAPPGARSPHPSSSCARGSRACCPAARGGARVLRCLLRRVQPLAPSVIAGDSRGQFTSRSPKSGLREPQQRSEVERGRCWGRRRRPGVREIEKKFQRSPFPRPPAPCRRPPHPSSPTWTVPLGAGLQLLGRAGHPKGAGPGGWQAVASSGVGAWQAPESEREHAIWLGGGVVLPTPVAGEHVCGAGPRGHLCSKPTCHL